MNVFEEMLENFQIEIFSNPKRSGPVSNHQMKEINSLLNRMEYVQKSDLNIGVKINEGDKPELLSYLKQNYELFEENFSEIIYISLSEFFKKKRITENVTEMANLYAQINEFAKNCSYKTSFESFVKSVSLQMLNTVEKEELLSRKETLNFFIQFFSDEEHFSMKKNWLSYRLKSKLDYLIDDLIQYLSKQFIDFEQSIDESIENGIVSFIEIKINQAYNTADVRQIEKDLYEMRISIIKVGDFESFIQNLNHEILSKNKSEDFLIRYEELNHFINLLPKDKKDKFIVFRQWVGIDFNLKV